MLKDLPPFSRDDSEVIMNVLPSTNEAIPPSDLNDDIFGSAPSSPNLVAREGAAPDADVHLSSEHSDIPRLRRIHVTTGYREGLAASKESHVQAGFDEGFSLGGEIGTVVGWCLGVLEGILAALARSGRDEAVAAAKEVEKVLGRAREELKMEKVLGPEWIGEDGIWTFDVPGQDEEEELEVTFKDVAAAHTVVKEWKERVSDMAERYGVRLAI